MLRLLLILALLPLFVAISAAEQSIAVFSRLVTLNPKNFAVDRVGQLTFRGGLVLTSPSSNFGGFSALHVSTNGARLLALSDRGAWLGLGLVYDTTGRMVGVRDATMGRLIGENGKVLVYRDTDAEAMAVLSDGSILIAFERHHRILHFPAASPPFSKHPVRFPAPLGIEKAPPNVGIEALTHLGKGFLVAISEYSILGDGSLAAWVGRAGAWERFAYVTRPGFRVADSGLLPSGDVLVLEHHYNFVLGHVARVVRLSRDSIAPNSRVEGNEVAVLKAPLITGNFEGISIRRGNGPETLVYLISDDNFDAMQRTVVLMFALEATVSPAPAR